MNDRADTAIAQAAEAGAIDLTKIDLLKVALAHFGDWKADTKAATEHFTTLVVEMPTQAKVDDYKSMRQRWINAPLAKARATSKALKSKLTSVSKDVGGELEAIEAAWADVDALITPQIDARQAELDAEREAKAQAEADRKARHEDKIATIRACVDRCEGLPSERIANGIAQVEGMTFGEDCEEFLAKYQAAQAETLTAMRNLHAQAAQREADELKRLENERIAAELAEQRAALERQAAELLAQRVAATHAIVLTFPEPEPAPAAPVDAPAPAPVAPSVRAALTPERACPLPSDPPAAAPSNPTAEQPAEVELMATGAVNARYGFVMTADFIKARGLEPQDNAKSKSGTWWAKSDMPKLDQALIDHIRSLSA